MNHHAQIHIEIIISIVFFVGFLLFIFLFLKPINNNDLNYHKGNENIIIKEISEEVITLPVIVESDSDCYTLENVIDEYGYEFIEVSNIPRHYTIFFADFFDKSLIGKISCNVPNSVINYKYGSAKNLSMIVYERIRELKISYENNYNSVKNNLEIGDFSFQFKDQTGKIIDELSVNRHIPSQSNVYAIEFPVLVINKEATIEELFLSVKIW